MAKRNRSISGKARRALILKQITAAEFADVLLGSLVIEGRQLFRFNRRTGRMSFLRELVTPTPNPVPSHTHRFPVVRPEAFLKERIFS